MEEGLQLTRLNKYLASLGVGSRRVVTRLIADGRVTVDGEIVDRPAAIVDPQAEVRIDGEAPPERVPRQYVALHKPEGHVSSGSDPSGRPTALDLLPEELHHLFPVGRLEKSTSGLLIFTNDGAFAQRLTHPKYQVPKTYVVETSDPVTEADLEALRQGVELKDGEAEAADIEVMMSTPRGATLRITIREGKHRQIHRMLRAVGVKVRGIVRTGVGSLRLASLGPGEWRPLTREEASELMESAGLYRASKSPQGR